MASGWKPRTAQVRLHTEAESSRKFLCFEIFAWDRLASRIYAATYMKIPAINQVILVQVEIQLHGADNHVYIYV